MKEIAEHLGVTSPQVSQFLSGAKTPTVDQAYLIASYFHWIEPEIEYAITLVEYERAGHHATKTYLMRRLAKLREQSLKLAQALGQAVELSDEDKARFYSSWVYSSIRLFFSIGDGKAHDEIAETFKELDEALEFLLRASLLKKAGQVYEMGRSERSFRKDRLKPKSSIADSFV